MLLKDKKKKHIEAANIRDAQQFNTKFINKKPV